MKRILFLLFLLNLQVSIAQIRIHNVNEAIEIAKRNSLVAKRGSISRALALKEVEMQRASILPQVNLYGAGEYYPVRASQVIPESVFGGQDGKFRKVQFGLPWNFSAGAELNFSILNLEHLAQISKSRLEVVENTNATAAALEDLNIAVTRYYYQALLAKELSAINAENKAIADTLVIISERRKEEGILNPSDLNRAKNLQLSLIRVEEDYRNLYMQSTTALAELLNLDQHESIELIDSIGALNFSIPAEDATNVAMRPAFIRATNSIEVAQKALSAASLAALPKLSLYSRYNYNWQFNNGFKGQPVHFDVNVIGMRLDIPVFNGGMIRHKKGKAELLVSIAELEKERVASELVKQQKQWHNDLSTAFRKNRINEERLQVVSDNLRIGKLNFNEGVMEFDELYNILVEYNQARVDHLNTLSDGIVYQSLLTLINNRK